MGRNGIPFMMRSANRRRLVHWRHYLWMVLYWSVDDWWPGAGDYCMLQCALDRERIKREHQRRRPPRTVLIEKP